jgi:membrane associated rhomboid family serine protease
MDWATAAVRVGILCSLCLAAAVVWRLSRPAGVWGDALRRRFLLGLPWGTLVASAGVLAVYLFLQGGLSNWYSPVTIPFRAWSYFYPLGLVTAGFAHNGPGHLLGNLLGTLALAPFCEYAWGHFPRERGAQSFGSLGTNPFVRAFVVVPLVIVAVGLLTALFAVGPIIGFSGVVFAFGGFALVRYPYATLLALLASRAAGTVRIAFQSPTLVVEARPIFYSPWWANIAIQGHALGLLIGALAGFWFVRARDAPTPSPLRLWSAVLLFGMTESLWAVYWFRGNAVFALYRGVGVVLVVLLATLVTAAVAASDRPLTPWLDRIEWRGPTLLALAVSGIAAAYYGLRGTGTLAVTTPAGLLDVPVLPALAGVAFLVALGVALWRPSVPNPFASTPRRQVAVVVLVLGLAAIVGPAIPVNLVTVSDQPLPGDTTEVRDYEVTYAENVTNGMVSAVGVSAFGETTQVRTSGVIVRSERRGIWTTAVTKSRLAFDGNRTVRLGGVGWRESVVANRTGWRVAGGGAAYRVAFYRDGERDPVYASPPANASPTIATRNVSVAPDGTDDFALVVTRENRTLDRAPMPAPNGSVTAGGLSFTRRDGTVYAERNGTRVAVAARETYE